MENVDVRKKVLEEVELLGRTVSGFYKSRKYLSGVYWNWIIERKNK